MTFEQWWEAYTKEVSRMTFADDLFKSSCRRAWEAGYTAARHDISQRVEEMNAKLFNKE